MDVFACEHSVDYDCRTIHFHFRFHLSLLHDLMNRLSHNERFSFSMLLLSSHDHIRCPIDDVEFDQQMDSIDSFDFDCYYSISNDFYVLQLNQNDVEYVI